ncbi:Pre-rRNA-processing protein TSR2-domain-containing protein [Coniella lustricola]|uniref:Pre-rRNA-processing protein TSR2-domain-containing protein n=1 Tax=Coniella lustricola TaxID=2025994 RepID=A0A2T2ZXV2_9PEZI|nr:Pre-rRNA-processing protein TSR2-domain-containing protein [Coniella lustricola]
MASSAQDASSADTRQSRFEQAVALSLNLWPALTLAVQNNWGGPDSADKRDWFAGEVASQFPPFPSSTSSTSTATSSSSSTTAAAAATAADQPDPDAEYIEELILQVMLDEFEVNVDDDSGYDVAVEIIRLRAQCSKGNFEQVDRLLERWQAKKGTKVQFQMAPDQDNDTDWDDTDGDDDDGDDDDDEEMDEAPPLVHAPKKEKAAPEVDEDGFTTVTRKR